MTERVQLNRKNGLVVEFVLKMHPITPYDEFLGYEKDLRGNKFVILGNYEHDCGYAVPSTSYDLNSRIPYLTLPFMLCDGTILRYNKRTKVVEILEVATDKDYDEWEDICAQYHPHFFSVSSGELKRTMFIGLDGYKLVSTLNITEQAFEQITKDAVKLPPIITDYIEEQYSDLKVEVYHCPTNTFIITKCNYGNVNKNEQFTLTVYDNWMNEIYTNKFKHYLDAYNEMYKHIGKKVE